MVSSLFARGIRREHPAGLKPHCQWRPTAVEQRPRSDRGPGPTRRTRVPAIGDRPPAGVRPSRTHEPVRPAQPIQVVQAVSNSSEPGPKLPRSDEYPQTATGIVLLGADSAHFGRPTVLAAVKAGAKASVSVRQNTLVQRAIESIPAGAWTPIEYPDAIRDEATGDWVSRAEVAEIAFTAFASAKASEQVPGRFVVRRIPDAGPPTGPDQASVFDGWRFHAFFTTVPTDVMATVAADKTHRGHPMNS